MKSRYRYSSKRELVQTICEGPGTLGGKRISSQKITVVVSQKLVIEEDGKMERKGVRPSLQ